MYFKKYLYIFCPPCAPKFCVMNEQTWNRILYVEYLYTSLTNVQKKQKTKELGIESSPFH